MKRNGRVFLTGGACLILSIEALAAHVFSPEPGTETLPAVVDGIRHLSDTEKRAGVAIRLKPGVYRTRGLKLDARDAGLEGVPIVWKAEKPGTVRLVTYADVPVSSFQSWRDGILVAPIEKVNFERMTNRRLREHEHVSLPIPDVIVDGKLMTPAQWPNEGWSHMASFVDEGSRLSNGNAPDTKTADAPRGGTFGYNGERPERWLSETNGWLEGYWCFDWSLSAIAARKIDTAARTITLAAPHVYGIRAGNKAPRRWRARHVLAELDAPGEYYVDPAQKKLYLMPPAGFDPATSQVAISSVESSVFSLADTHDITFENLDFSESWRTLLDCRGCRRITVRNCRFYAGHADGAAFRSCFDCAVTGCDFHDLGAGGVSLTDDDVTTLTRSNNLVEDCLFRFCSRLRLTYAPSIRCRDTVGATIRHCEVTDQPHIGVVIDGNDMLFEYNVISNVCYAADDASGYYAGRRPACQGNEIRHCLLKDIRTRLGSKSGMCGIYLDDGQPGHNVHHTIFVNAGTASVKPDGDTGLAGAMFTNAGFSNRCENCIFVDCVQAIDCYRQTDKQWLNELDKGIKSDGAYWSLQKRGGLAFFTNALYLARYPMLRDWLTVYKPAATRQNTARNNVFVRCGRRDNPKHGGWDLDDTDIVLDASEDPGFVDAAHGNYALRDDSIVYRKLPGFTPIAFEKIGLLHRR